MTVRRLLVGIAFLAACACAHAVPVHAQADGSGSQIDEDTVQNGIGDCVNADTADGRLGCYPSLCEPSYLCAEALLRAAVREGGPTLGFTVLNDLMTQHKEYSIYTDGHELAHVIGRQLAKDFGSSGDAFLRCPSDYYYGCQHGFFQVTLAESDSPVEAAQSVCESAPVNQRFFCYHGVGHGFMMTYDYDLNGVLDKCNQLPEADYKRQACWQGAFMENINSYLRGEAIDGAFDTRHPLSPCDKLDQQYRWECYYNQASFLLRIHNDDIAKASAECLDADDTARPACSRGLGQLAGNPGWQREIMGDDTYREDQYARQSVNLCQLFPESQRQDCITGVIENMLNYGQEANALLVCGLLADFNGQRDTCFRDMGAAMLRNTYQQDRRATFCPQVPAEYRHYCDPDGSLSKPPPPPENIVLRVWHAVRDFFAGIWNAVAGLFAVSDTVRPDGSMTVSSAPPPPATESN